MNKEYLGRIPEELKDFFDCTDFEKNLELKLYWMDTKQAAEYLSISPTRLLTLVGHGKIKYFKLGKSNRYRRKDLDELLESEPRGPIYGHKVQRKT